MKAKSTGRIQTGLAHCALALMVVVCSACASAPAAEPDTGRQPITVHVDNTTSRVVTVDRIVALSGSPGTSAFGSTVARGERPVTRRVGLVNGQSKRTFEIPWHPSRLAHELLWLEGVSRIATDSETLGPGQHSSTYQVERCRGTGLNACVATYALYLPPGSEVTLVIDFRHEARMYYDVPP